MTYPAWKSPPGWWESIVCSIGLTEAGSFYCVAVCAEHYYDGKCDQEASVDELATFEKFKAREAANERKRKADPKVARPQRRGKMIDGYGKGQQ